MGKQKGFSGSALFTLSVAGGIMQLLERPKIKGNTVYVKMDLYLQGSENNKEWAGKIWNGIHRNEEVEKVIILAKAQNVDSYCKTENVESEIDITELIEPLSEARKYSQSSFANEFGDKIVEYVSMKMLNFAC